MYDTIIIGAGIGGLTCGAILARAGKKVLIIERHTKPGGYVTSYSRDGFIFDVPHVIGGLREKARLWEIIRELGVNIDFIELEPYQKIIYPDHEIRVYTDIEKYKIELKNAFPEDSEDIDRYYETLLKLNTESPVPKELSTLDLLSFPLKFPTVFKYRNAVFEKLLNDHVKNPKLKAILTSAKGYAGSPPSKVSALFYAGMLMSYHTGGAWYPKGGYQKITDAFVKAFEDQGGELFLNAEVKKILVKKGKAEGVELLDGRTIKSNLVVSNADTKRTLLDLVGEVHLKKKLADRIRNAELSNTGLVVHLGVKMDLESLDLNYGTIFINKNYERENIFFPDEKISINSFGISVPSLHDKSIAPDGCHTMDILLTPAPYDFKNMWLTEQRKRTDAYKKLKDEMADKLIKAAELVIPNLSRNVVVKEIATPLTYERFTLASGGCWYDLAQTPSQSMMNRLANSKIIKNLLFTGAKSIPGGGMYGAITSGYLTAKRILK